MSDQDRKVQELQIEETQLRLRSMKEQEERNALRNKMALELMQEGVSLLKTLTEAAIRMEEKRLDAKINQEGRATAALEMMAEVFKRLDDREETRRNLDKMVEGLVSEHLQKL